MARRLALLFAACLIGSFSVFGTAQAQNAQLRDGFWFSGGLGYGSLGCDNCLSSGIMLPPSISSSGGLDGVEYKLGRRPDVALTFADYLDKRNEDARRYEQLRPETIRFIEEIERVAVAPVSMVSTRFDFRSIIDRRYW